MWFCVWEARAHCCVDRCSLEEMQLSSTCKRRGKPSRARSHRRPEPSPRLLRGCVMRMDRGLEAGKGLHGS
jgi:hypothetical protein